MSEYAISNPFAGSVLADSWWLQRRSPGGRVAHYLDPVSLISVCGVTPEYWEYFPEEQTLKICKKCISLAKRLRWEH